MARANSGNALVSNAVLVTDKHQVKRVGVDNTGAAVAYLMLFDSAAAPVNGQTPDLELAVAAGAHGEFDFEQAGEHFKNGLAVALSTTPATLTLAGAIGFFWATYY